MLLQLISCSEPISKSEEKFRTISDSIDSYLELANKDSITNIHRIEFNNKAYSLIRQNQSDSLQIANLFKVANRYYNLNVLNAYKRTSRNALDAAIIAKDTTNIAKAYNYLGDYFLRTSTKDSAFYYYLKSEKIYKFLRDNVQLATLNLNKGTVLWYESDFFGSESATLEALKYLRFTNDFRKTYEAYTLLGLISNELNDYESALEYHNKALVVILNSLRNDQEHPYSITLSNIGNVYQKMDNHKEAINKFNIALDEEGLLKDNPKIYAIILDNLAYSKLKLNVKDPEIKTLFDRALQIQDSLDDIPLQVFTHVRFSEYYASTGDTANAVILAKEGLRLAISNKKASDILGPLKKLSVLIPSADYSSDYIRISDSLQHAERKSKDKFGRIQYETEELTLEKDKLEAKNRNLLLFFMGTVMIGLLLFIIRTQRTKNRELLHKQAQQKANEDIYSLMLSQQNKIEEGRIKEKKRIAQELHDGVLGRLFGARLNLDSLNKMDGEDAEEKRNNYLSELKNIEQDIREISHDLNREKFVLINNFVAILNNLLEEQSALFDSIVQPSIDENIQWDKVSNSIKINLYRVVQEALQNINKYAKASTINVSLRQTNGRIELEITDDGIGFSVDRKSKGIGLQNMMSRASECNGSCEIKSKKGKGTILHFNVPLESNPITA